MAGKEKKMRFGVVGAGKLGGFHSRTLSKMPEVELVGISDPNLLRALYGEDQRFELTNGPEGGARVRVVLPYVEEVDGNRSAGG